MGILVLLRHGESQWNPENRFTGWVDVPLSPKGEEEARQAEEKLKVAGIRKFFRSSKWEPESQLCTNLVQRGKYEESKFCKRGKSEKGEWIKG